MSQVIRKNSASRVFSMTSSSRCSRAATARSHGVVLALHRLLAEPVEHGERRLPFGHGIAREAHIAEVERHLAGGGDARRVVERLGEVGEQRAKLCLAMETVLAVGQEQTVRRRLVEGGAMADRGEHVEEWLVVGGRVVRGRARHQRDVRGTGDRRAFRDQPAIGGMEVIAHQHRRAVAPETLTELPARDAVPRGDHHEPAHRQQRSADHR